MKQFGERGGGKLRRDVVVARGVRMGDVAARIRASVFRLAHYTADCACTTRSGAMLSSHVCCCGAVAALVFRLPGACNREAFARVASLARGAECCAAKRPLSVRQRVINFCRTLALIGGLSA